MRYHDAQRYKLPSVVDFLQLMKYLHDIVLHHICYDEVIATHNDDEYKHGLITQLVHNIVQPCNVVDHHWHCHQRQRSTDIHEPNLCLVAYGRYAHKQGKGE